MLNLKRIIVFLFLPVFTFSQGSLKVEDKGGNDISMSEKYVSGFYDDYEIVYYFYVRNTTLSDLNVKAKRIELDVNCSTEHALCWDVCPPPVESCSKLIENNISVRNILAGEADNTGVGHLYPKDTQGTSKYRYVFYLESDENDSTYIDVLYDHSLLNTKNTDKQVLSISPNPASNFLNIEIADGKNYSLQLINILGKTVMSRGLTSKNYLDVSAFDRGIYFVKITNEKGVEVKTSKIVLE